MSEAAPLSPPVTRALVLLTRTLRAEGVRLGVGELLASHRALAVVDAADREQSRLALRSALCSRWDDLDVFDVCFDACFPRGPEPGTGIPEGFEDATRIALPRAPGGGRGGEQRGVAPGDPEAIPSAWSDVELLKRKDFSAYTDAERAAAVALVRRIAARAPLRRSRRTRLARGGGRGNRLDLRATVRASLPHGGVPIDRRWREDTLRPRPLVLVCDVSGSMEPYARMLLQYVQASVAARRRVEAFAFGTRLTRLTLELRGGDPDAALRRASAAVADWQGGTRIGAALAALNREHGRRVGRGAVVVVLSDGWDRGDPSLLAAEAARLRRTAHRLIWCNPLKAAPGYEPLTRGMQAALPHVDRFLAGNTIASLEELALTLEGGQQR